MSYQYHDEDEQSYRFKHPDGSNLIVAKKGLGKEVLKRIEGMKPPIKMADGGKVPTSHDKAIDNPTPDNVGDGYYRADDADSDASRAPASIAGDTAHAVGQGLNNAYNAWNQTITQPLWNAAKDAASGFTSGVAGLPAQAQVGPPAPINTAGPSPASAMPPSDFPQNPQTAQPQSPGMPGAPGSGFDYNQIPGFKEELGATQGLAKAQGQQSQETGQAYQQYAQQIQQQQALHQANLAAINQDLSKNQQAILQGQIDPNRLWHNSSTGNKVLSAISIALSGLGSGLTGKSNMAMDLMQKNIDRDVDAQRSDLGKQQTLYSMNLQKYQNEGAADAATRLNLNTMMQAQIAQAAAKAGTAEAASRAQLAVGQLKQSAIPYMQQLAQYQTQSQLYGQGSSGGGIPHQQENIPMMLRQNPKYLETRIAVSPPNQPGASRVYAANTKEDADAVKKVQSEYEPVRSMIGQLSALGPEAAISGTEANLKANALRAGLVPRLNKLHGLNRLSEEDVKLMGDQLSDPTKLKQLVNGNVLNTQFMKNLNEDVESTYQTYLPGYRGAASVPSSRQGFK